MDPPTLQDPERCPFCQRLGKVIDSRTHKRGYRRRRHECGVCDERWTSYQTTVPFAISAFAYTGTLSR